MSSSSMSPVVVGVASPVHPERLVGTPFVVVIYCISVACYSAHTVSIAVVVLVDVGSPTLNGGQCVVSVMLISIPTTVPLWIFQVPTQHSLVAILYILNNLRTKRQVQNTCRVVRKNNPKFVQNRPRLRSSGALPPHIRASTGSYIINIKLNNRNGPITCDHLFFVDRSTISRDMHLEKLRVIDNPDLAAKSRRT